MVTRHSVGCQAHICVYIIINEREIERESERARERERERERERDRDRESERERERNRIQKSGKKNYPDNFPVCWLRFHLSRFFTGISRTARAMWCSVDYVYKWEREREKERERKRERDGESILQDHIITMRWELYYIRVYPTIFSCVDPRYQLSRFFPGFSRKKYGELILLIGNQRVGIFPPKSEILFVLSLALIWYRNFQDRTIPLGGDAWSSFWRKELITRYTSARQYVMPCESGWKSRDYRPTVEQRFLDVSSNLGKFWKNSQNGHATVDEVTRPSADCQTTFLGRFNRFGKILKKVAERSRDSGRRSRDRRPTVKQRFFGRFRAIWENFEKSRWTVTRQWLRSRDRRPTVKQRFLDVSSDFGKFFKKVAERSRDSGRGHATLGRLSNNVFWTFQAIWEIFWKKSLNGHATVVGGHATVGRLSNNIFRTFQAIWENFEKKSLNGHATVVEVTRPSADCQTTFFGRFKRFGRYFEKSRWTVTRQWSEVTLPSADCQTTYLGRFKRFGKILKKVAERSRDSGWGHATVGQLSNNVFWTFSSDLETFWKKSLNGHATVVGGHATVGRLSNNVFWTFQAIWKNFEKSRWTVTRQWMRSRDRRPTVKQRFLDVSSDLGKFWKKVAERSRDSGWGHATVGRLSNNVFWTFQAIWEIFWKKSLNGHATVVGGHATVGRLSNNVFWTFQAIWGNFEKSRWTVTRQWLRSRDRRPTVKQRFLDVSSDLGKFWKKSLNGHATVVDVTRPSADCQTTFLDISSDLGKFWKKSLNGHATVAEVTRPSADCQTTFFRRFKRFGKILKKVAERSRDSGWGHATVGRLSNNVF